MSSLEKTLLEISQKAKQASIKAASLSEEIKNKALLQIADKIEESKVIILEANKKDLINAESLIKEGKMQKAFYDRLKLDNDKLDVMIQGIKDVAKLEDPVNKKLWAMELDKDLNLYKVSCPIGVIGVIFESRPDVTTQISALAVKSANAVILKGGSEAANSNEILVNLINEALATIKEMPENMVNLIKTRHDVEEMLKMDEFIDLIIPRGSNSLVKYIQSNTKIPVLGHAEGICHVYIDEFADFYKATKILIDSKTQYPSACNAVETILVNEKIAENYLPILVAEMEKTDVIVKGDEKTRNLTSVIEKATEEDWKTEYGDKIVSVKVVKDIFEAIEHINKYGSGHTDSIVTENKNNAEIFMNLVDSSSVYHNASTRFADGFRYGFGAEVGISTNKTHARGPVGMDGLVIYKYKLYGNGQTVGEYSGANAKKFTHKKLI
jgi:glutamate-5-semialdehyde dehydrogenase